MEIELWRKHENEMHELEDRMNSDPSMKYHMTPKLLNMYKMIESMGYVGKYKEAKEMKI